jgi:hypothetical protein
MRTALNYIIDGIPSLWNALDSEPNVKLKDYKKHKSLNSAQIVSRVRADIKSNWAEVGKIMKVEFKKVKQLDK